MEFDYNLLLLAYTIINDDSIHDRDVQIINEYIYINNISEENKIEMYKILGDEEDKIPLELILLIIDNYDSTKVKELLSIILKIILLHGYISDEQHYIINRILRYKISKSEYKSLQKQIYYDINNKVDESKELTFKYKLSIGVLSILKKINISNFTLEKMYNDFLLKGPEYSKTIDKISNIAKKDLEESKKSLMKSKEVLEELNNSINYTLYSIKNSIKKTSKHFNNNIMSNIALGAASIKNLSPWQNIINKNIWENKILKKINNQYSLNNIEKTHIFNNDDEILNDENKKELEDSLTKLKDDISEMLELNIKETNEVIEKKNRALKYYTISFMGRTKMGKSTLHYIITGRGNEFIGDGKQRKTRFNRIYEWENIKIIDTPGIGAPGGKSDEEIAKNIIDESDLICYVLDNDSTQQTTWEFLKIIKDRNKPIIILLNVKEDIENEKRLQKFLKDPQKWFNRTDRRNLQGHIDKIKEDTKKYYNNDYFDIIPVQMLAASMSKDEKYSEIRKTLYDASHIQYFLDNIRVQIIEEGFLRKSQTMIDGSIYIINKTNNIIKNNLENFNSLYDKFKENKELLIKKLEKSYNENSNLLKEELESEFKDLKDNKALEFSTRNYNTKKKEINNKWEEYLKEIHFEENIKNKIEKSFSNYENSLEEYLKEFVENMELFSKIKMNKINFDITNTFNSQVITNIIFNTIGFIVMLLPIFQISIPMLPVIIGIAIVNIVVNKFIFKKDKQAKIKEATDKLYESIKQGIEENQEKIINNICSMFSEHHNNIIKSIYRSMNILLNYLEETMKYLQTTNERLEKEFDNLNKIYAYRILNYLLGKKTIDIDKNAINNIKVIRDYGKSIKIFSKYKINSKLKEKITKIIQENVFFLIK